MKTEKERIIHAILKDELEIRIKFKKYQEAHMYETRTPLVTSKPHWSGNQLAKHVEYLADRISDRLLKEAEKKKIKEDLLLKKVREQLPNTGGWNAERKNDLIFINYSRQKFTLTDKVSEDNVTKPIIERIVNDLTNEMEKLRKEVII